MACVLTLPSSETNKLTKFNFLIYYLEGRESPAALLSKCPEELGLGVPGQVCRAAGVSAQVCVSASRAGPGPSAHNVPDAGPPSL